MSVLLDARGVAIAPGDSVIYPYTYGSSAAVAEGIVLEDEKGDPDTNGWGRRVSLTPSGRVRVRVIRRSYGGGSKDVVDIAPDRMVVLKHPEWTDGWDSGSTPSLPLSPLPTQREANRQRIESLIEAYTAYLRATEVPDRHYYEGWTLDRFHANTAVRLAELRKELRALDDQA